ncbi:unnamed protein product [Didymodactylos carnosus]|uniref:Uncharacterized protein n=1 Tax=Didymodactylos carnosus TaxID=1234261 RepID=A0A8S2NTD3_9BILA|nr:unnamed protein product [Didymodactylos carnosus]CAF4018639.1 unnamed protein product [Didymodactylos carnosus]
MVGNLRDFASVQFLLKDYPVTKKQKNKAGDDALAIARKQNYKRLVQLLEGKPIDPIDADDADPPTKPKYEPQQLIRAAGNGQMQIVKEFVQQRYLNIDEKRQICYQMLQEATKKKQDEVLGVLQPYYNKELLASIPSDARQGSLVTLSEEYQTMLVGFLTGLSGLIASSPVVLDPADPNTYKELFSNVNAKFDQRTQEISKITSERDVNQLCKQDMKDIEQKISKLTDEMRQLSANKDILTKRIQDADEGLLKVKDMTALQRKELFQNKEATEQHLAALDSSMYLFRRAQEAALKKKKTLEYIKEKTKLFLFYTTIEHNLQSLFNSVLVAQGGLSIRDKTNTKAGMAASVIQAIPTSWIPIGN